MDRIVAARALLYKSYTAEEKADLARRYTPEQLKAIEAGEAAIDPKDIVRSGPQARKDPLRPRELDEHAFARIQPVIDKRLSRLRGEWDNADDKMPNKNSHIAPDEDEMLKKLSDVMLDPTENYADQPMNEGLEQRGTEAGTQGGKRDPLTELWRQVTNDPDNVRNNDGVERFFNDETSNAKELDFSEATATEHRLVAAQPPLARAEIIPSERRKSTQQMLNDILTAGLSDDPPEVAPSLPRINEPHVRWEDPVDQDDGAVDDETALAFQRLSKQTGQPVSQLRSYRTKVISAHRVVNQTRMGKISSDYFLVVAGDGNGMLGLGEGKAAEIDAAQRIAKVNAIRAMRPIRRYEKRTVFGEVKGKCGAVELTISARPPGFGLRCSHHIFEMARCAGLTDLSAKIHRSRNPMNVAKATWEALCSQKDPEDVARARGKKMVDVRKVYYAGLV